MNTRTVALARISPLQVRQGLLLSLALLLTLVAAQLHHNGQQQDLRGMTVVIDKASAPVASTRMQSQPATISTFPLDRAALRQRWVF